MRLPIEPEPQALMPARRAPGSPATREVCVVCCKPVDALHPRASPERGMTTCTAPFCRGVVAQAARMAASHFRVFLESQRELIRKRELAAAAESLRRARLEKLEDAEHREIRRRFLLAHPESSRRDLVSQEIPSGSKALAPLTPDRVESYRCHLVTVIGEAAVLVNQMPDTNQGRQPCLPGGSANSDNSAKAEVRLSRQPRLAATSENLCGLCRGACCIGGKERAYIDVDTILRILRQRPGISNEQILAEYLSHLQSETVADSCVNHTDTGCSLPRELRSDTCNDFFCDSLVSYHNAAGYDAQPARVLAVQRARKLNQRYALGADRSIVKIALVDAKGAFPVDLDHSDIEKLAMEEIGDADYPWSKSSSDE